MQHAVQYVVAEGTDRAVDMRRLAAAVAIGACQEMPAIEAAAMRRAMALSMVRLKRPGRKTAGHQIADGFDFAAHKIPPVIAPSDTSAAKRGKRFAADALRC
jgi:hypothetical protein